MYHSLYHTTRIGGAVSDSNFNKTMKKITKFAAIFVFGWHGGAGL